MDGSQCRPLTGHAWTPLSGGAYLSLQGKPLPEAPQKLSRHVLYRHGPKDSLVSEGSEGPRGIGSVALHEHTGRLSDHVIGPGYDGPETSRLSEVANVGKGIGDGKGNVAGECTTTHRLTAAQGPRGAGVDSEHTERPGRGSERERKGTAAGDSALKLPSGRAETGGRLISCRLRRGPVIDLGGGELGWQRPGSSSLP